MPDATVTQFRRRAWRGEVEHACTRDQVIEHHDGSWASYRRPPRGIGWEIERDRERHTIWRRAIWPR